MQMFKGGKLFVLISMCLSLAACGGDDDNGGGDAGSVAMSLRIPGVTDVTALVDLVNLFESPRSSARVNTASGLEELEYYITSIKLCENIDLSGSGYSNETGCVYMYKNESADYNSYLIAEADAETDEDAYIDLMDATSIAKLAKTVDVDAGTYRYGLVGWNRPFKINASIDVGGTAIKTCDTASATHSIVDNGATGLNLMQTHVVDDMVNCNQGKVSVMLTNGGALFAFSQPVEIEGGTDYKLDLAFNPTAVMVGATAANPGAGTQVYRDDIGSSIDVSFSDLAPVLRSNSQKTFKEVYESNTVIVGQGNTSNSFTFKMLVELYFIGEESDAGTATIQAVNLRALHDASATAVANLTGSVATGTEIVAGELNLLNWEASPTIGGLTRQSTIGGSDSSVSINFDSIGWIVDAGQETATTTMTLIAITEVK